MIDCNEWNGDEPIRLDQLAEKIKELQAKYGVKAVVSFDAGYNNVSVMIQPTKKQGGDK